MIPAKRAKSEMRGEGAEVEPQPTIPVYLIYGEDEYLVGSNGRRIVEGLCPAGDRVFGVEEINGQADTIDAALAALRQCLVAVQTVGFFGGRKVVWFRDVRFLKNAVILRNEKVRAWLDELTALIKAGLPAGHQLVITASGVDGRSSFFKACGAAGIAVAFTLPERSYQALEQAAGRAAEAFRAAGLSTAPGTMECFIDRTGPDTRTIYAEVEKLAVYLGERKEVRPADVLDITSPSRESEGWDLADRVGARDLPGALEVLRRLLHQKEEPIAMIAGLESRFRDLTLLRESADRGWARGGGRLVWAESIDATEALSALGDWDPRKMHPYRAGLLLEQSRKFEPRELARAGTEITKVREQMVSGFSSPELLLELLVIKLTAPRPRAAARPAAPAR